MMDLEHLADDLERDLRRAIELKERVTSLLETQENALVRGDTEQIFELNRTLDEELENLRLASARCRESADSLAAMLGLPPGAAVREVVLALPDERAPALLELRNRLVRARRAARAASSRNASIARSSLTAIATVRRVLEREAVPATADAGLDAQG